jgi:hypothetical protein
LPSKQSPSRILSEKPAPFLKGMKKFRCLFPGDAVILYLGTNAKGTRTVNGKDEENVTQRNTQICFWLVVSARVALPLPTLGSLWTPRGGKEILLRLLLTFSMYKTREM